LSTPTPGGESQSTTADIGEAKKQALHYLKFRARSSTEMRQYLSRKGYQPPIQEKVVGWLQELGYIDDLQFSLQWIENRCRTNPRGERRLVLELRQKGIRQPIIDEAMIRFRETVNETELAYELAANRVKAYHRDDQNTKRRKLISYLERRGFRMNDIRQVIDQVLEE